MSKQPKKSFRHTLLHDDEGQNAEVGVDDATTDGLSLAFTSAAWSVARVASRQQKSDTSVGQDALLHGETLLVVTAGNSEDVALPFVTQRIAFDLLAHAFVIEGTNFVFIVKVEELLAASGRV